jgi:hypothetical protein
MAGDQLIVSRALFTGTCQLQGLLAHPFHLFHCYVKNSDPS